MNQDDMEWAFDAVAGWPALGPLVGFQSLEESETARREFCLRLDAVKPGMAREVVFRGQDVRFFGGQNWSDPASSIARIPDGQRLSLVLDLFGRTLLDFALEARHTDASFHIRNKLRLLRFGYCGMGPHLSDPFLLLNRPEDEGLFAGTGMDSAIDMFVEQYSQRVELSLHHSSIPVPISSVHRALLQLPSARFFDFYGLFPQGPLATLVWDRLSRRIGGE